jgi:ribokinase
VTPRRIWVVGSINMDVAVRVETLPLRGETVTGSDAVLLLGGKGANQAIAAARLRLKQSDDSVFLIACVGADSFGQVARDALTAEALDCSMVGSVQAATGVALITLDSQGQNTIALSPGANAHLTVSHVDVALLNCKAGDLLLLQNEVPPAVTLHAAKVARRAGGFVIVDPAPSTGFFLDLLAFADIVTPNETEATMISGIAVHDVDSAQQAARWFVAHGVKTAIVKLGAAGVVYAGQYGEAHVVPPAVIAVDTVAAGDCFNGALAVALSEGLAFDSAVRFAGNAAAVSVTRRGASSSMPYRHEIP